MNGTPQGTSAPDAQIMIVEGRAKGGAGPISLVTANRKGRTSSFLNEVSEAFVGHAKTASKPVIDLGCAFGVASIAALEAGASVIAIDVSREHVEAVVKGAGSLGSRLQTAVASFPDQLDFPPESISSVHASNLLNFLDGESLTRGLAKVFRWLEPGGMFFSISGTPYARNVQGFISTYEARREDGAAWPGECEDLRKYSNDPTLAELPPQLHLLDDSVLRRAAIKTGFQVVECAMFRRANTPSYIALDGRENVKLIVMKPKAAVAPMEGGGPSHGSPR